MNRLAYWGALAAALVAAVLFGFTTLADQLDNDVYDFVFRAHVNTERIKLLTLRFSCW